MSYISIKSVLITAIYVLLNLGLSGQEHENPDNKEGHDRHSKHHLAIFNGATTNFSHHNSTDYTLGLGYEFRFSEKGGVGLLGEFIFTDSEEIVTGIPLFIHLFKGVKIIAAPMSIFVEEHTDSHDLTPPEKEASFYARIGLGYDFHISKLSIDFGF